MESCHAEGVWEIPIPSWVGWMSPLVTESGCSLGIAAYVWRWKKGESLGRKMEFQKQKMEFLYLCPECLDHPKYVNCNYTFCNWIIVLNISSWLRTCFFWNLLIVKTLLTLIWISVLTTIGNPVGVVFLEGVWDYQMGPGSIWWELLWCWCHCQSLVQACNKYGLVWNYVP